MSRSSHIPAMPDIHTPDIHIGDPVSDELLWDQVLRRQPGEFRYAVTTMGVYCRPGCPSPRPLRKNVRFFLGNAAAEAAGFRACKRCDPKGERAAIAQAVVRDACTRIDPPLREVSARHWAACIRAPIEAVAAQ